jgi:cytoskeletal protein RodZ
MLRRARELRGLTLERVARETKIPQRHLEALEHDNLAVIPAGFYQRAELRTYAQAVGLDQRVALEKLELELAAPVEEREPSRGTRSTTAPTSPLPYIAVAVAGIAVVAVLFGRANVEPTPGLSPAIETGVAPAPASQPVVSSAEPATVPDAAPSAVTPSAAAAQTVVEPTQAPAPAASVTELVISTEPEGARITVNGIGWGSSPARIQYLEPGQKRIRVSKEGYAAVERVLQVDQGRRHVLNIRLESAQ